jgi:hypothetical protein
MTAAEALAKTQEVREQNTDKFIDKIIKEADGIVFGATTIGKYTCTANLVDKDLFYVNRDRMKKELTDYYSKNGYKVDVYFSSYFSVSAISIKLDWSEANE